MANDQLSQVGAEVLLLPTDAKARFSEFGLEVLLAPTSADARFSEIGFEVLYREDDFVPSSYSAGILELSPWLYWRLGDTSGTVADDASSNGRDGTYSGSPTLAQSGVLNGEYDDGAVYFDATNDRLISPGIFNFGAATVVVFFDYDGTLPGSTGFIAGCAEGEGSNSSDKVLQLTTAGKVAWTTFDGGGHTVTDTNDLGTGWHMLVGRVGYGVADLWVDGVRVGYTASGPSYTGYVAPNVAVGGKNDYTGPTRVAGKRDEFAIFDKVLTDKQIVGLWLASMFSPSSGGKSFDILQLG